MSRKPLPFDRGLSQRSRQILLFAIPVWCASTMMVLGNKNLVSNLSAAIQIYSQALHSFIRGVGLGRLG